VSALLYFRLPDCIASQHYSTAPGTKFSRAGKNPSSVAQNVRSSPAPRAPETAEARISGSKHAHERVHEKSSAARKVRVSIFSTDTDRAHRLSFSSCIGQ